MNNREKQYQDYYNETKVSADSFPIRGLKAIIDGRPELKYILLERAKSLHATVEVTLSQLLSKNTYETLPEPLEHLRKELINNFTVNDRTNDFMGFIHY